jgi:hypothetical protein
LPHPLSGYISRLFSSLCELAHGGGEPGFLLGGLFLPTFDFHHLSSSFAGNMKKGEEDMEVAAEAADHSSVCQDKSDPERRQRGAAEVERKQSAQRAGAEGR